MAPQVVKTLIGRLPSLSGARLQGYTRHPVKGQGFPGLIPVSSSQRYTNGILYTDLTDPELKKMDWFEDVEYRRSDIIVSLLDETQTDSQLASAATTTCQTYEWTNPLSELDLTREWSFEDFLQNDLKNFLVRTVQPCREELDRLRLD
jgi:hypothetical protein